MNSTSIAELQQLEIILLSDVDNLQKSQTNNSENNEIKELLGSLVNAKKGILNQIPGAAQATSHSPAPPQSNLTPHLEYGAVVDGGSDMIQDILKIEERQMQVVKELNGSEALPEEIQSKIKEVLLTYQKITTQLIRATKTKQINPIVI